MDAEFQGNALAREPAHRRQSPAGKHPMAEPLTDKTSAPARPSVAHAPRAATINAGDRDAVRQALTCLRSSERRLRNMDEQRTDEVLTLLRAASAHLQRAASGRE